MAASRDLFMPRPPGGLGSGLVLALLVHGLLVAALAFGVSWRSSNPQGIQAELWAAVPQVAAPRAAVTEQAPPPPPRPAPEPPPPPRPAPPVERTAPPPPARPDPKIALEQEKQQREAARQQELAELAARKAKAEQAARQREAEQAAEKRKAQALQAERERELAENRQKAADAKAKAEQAAKAEAEAKRLAEAREAAIRRMTAQAGGSTGEPGSTGTADRTAAPSDGYTGRVIARIKPNIVFVDTLASNPEAEVLVRLAPDGRIISQKLVRSSGSREWDQAVQRAIERTELLPRDIDGRVPSSMSITFRPRE